jgi:glycosyltransferase involved in cell wall biosynthesis
VVAPDGVRLDVSRPVSAPAEPGIVGYAGHLYTWKGVDVLLDAVAGLLERAGILVLPNLATAISTHFTSPLKVFEYMAAGRAIVASDLPAIREVLEHERNALLVPAGDGAALADALRRLIDDPALAARLARTASADVEAFGWDQRAERLERILEHARASR